MPGVIGSHSLGAIGGAGAAGIDDDDLAAAPLDGVDLAHDVGAREQRALRRVRVRAHDDEQVGAPDVGDGDASTCRRT